MSNNRPIIGRYRLILKPDVLTLMPKTVSIIQIFYCSLLLARHVPRHTVLVSGAAFAASSAHPLPRLPVRPGIQTRVIVFPVLKYFGKFVRLYRILSKVSKATLGLQSGSLNSTPSKVSMASSQGNRNPSTVPPSTSTAADEGEGSAHGRVAAFLEMLAG